MVGVDGVEVDHEAQALDVFDGLGGLGKGSLLLPWRGPLVKESLNIIWWGVL